MANDDKTLRDRVVAISKYVSNQAVLEGYTFLGCQINGPAILFFQSEVRFQHNSFDGDLDAILWEVPLSRPRVVGVVAVRNCVFDRCRLTHVGIAGPPDFISQFRATARET
ncbi:MAG TPA: hypothetical protein VET65_01145 [Candidatus Limnocylindrales bacterium]|nr:hypothetical protein [Candidatus Limnocylindrales bacterium]